MVNDSCFIRWIDDELTWLAGTLDGESNHELILFVGNFVLLNNDDGWLMTTEDNQ